MPLLAIAAYVTVLRIGFVGDDFVLLFEAATHPVNLQSLLPVPYATFYRPVGTILIWQLGWYLWGYNPLPFHVQGLLIHAGVSLVLGLWLASITGRRSLGWLAGALFAIFPLHIEAVGWLAAQWDSLAAFFALLSMWLFTGWWRRGSSWGIYALSLIFYTLGLFTKESILSWLPMLAVSAWYVTPRFDAARWRRLVVSILPFCVPLALNIGLRFVTWGKLGGYSAPTDYASFIWDSLIGDGRFLLSPINVSVSGARTAQVIGVATTFLLLVLLVCYGRSQRRLLAVSGAWILLCLIPVLSYPVDPLHLGNNRYLYLAAAGYCVGVAALLQAAIADARRWRLLAASAVGLAMLAGIGACWLQLRPLHADTVLAQEVGQELHRVIPPQPHPQGLVWRVENAPFPLGLDRLRYFADGEVLQFKAVPSAAQANLIADKRDAFALRFKQDPGSNQYHVDYAAGITSETTPPQGAQAGDNLRIWDFRDCDSKALSSWEVTNAQPVCEPGKGLELRNPGTDEQILGPKLSVQPGAGPASFVRLRVSAVYPPGAATGFNQWYWQAAGAGISEARSLSTNIKADGLPHVYWTFVPASALNGELKRLRFDPANQGLQSTVQWIALDTVK